MSDANGEGHSKLPPPPNGKPIVGRAHRTARLSTSSPRSRSLSRSGSRRRVDKEKERDRDRDRNRDNDREKDNEKDGDKDVDDYLTGDETSGADRARAAILMAESLGLNEGSAVYEDDEQPSSATTLVPPAAAAAAASVIPVPQPPSTANHSRRSSAAQHGASPSISINTAVIPNNSTRSSPNHTPQPQTDDYFALNHHGGHSKRFGGSPHSPALPQSPGGSHLHRPTLNQSPRSNMNNFPTLARTHTGRGRGPASPAIRGASQLPNSNARNATSSYAAGQYQIQERAYLAKLRDDLTLVDDYTVRELNSGTMAGDDSDSDDDESTAETPSEGLGLGGVGTSFDDEYADFAMTYPFLEASNTQGEVDTPESMKERMEWQIMLSSVLNGEVVRSEKTRLTTTKQALRNIPSLQDDDLWIGIRSRVCGRSIIEQKQALDYSRSKVHAVLESVLSFRVRYETAETASLDSATEQVSAILSQLDKCELLWKSKLAMRQENAVYGSPEFQQKYEALTAWMSITESINKELELLRVWTGNVDLNPNVPLPRESATDSAADKKVADKKLTDDKETLVEIIMKHDDVSTVFELRIQKSMGPLIEKARQTTSEHSAMFVEMGLPLFHERLAHLLVFPITLLRDVINLRLTYARRLTNPTMMIVDQTIDDLLLYIQLSAHIVRKTQEYTDPIFDKGWVFPNLIDEGFLATVRDCLQFYLGLLQSKFLDNVKPFKSYQAFKETEIEQQHHALRDIGTYIDGADIVIAESFSSMESKILTRIISYWEGQIKGINLSDKKDIERWISITIENVRSFQRKLLRFYRVLCTDYENAMEFSLKISKVKSFVEILRKTSHFIVYTGAYEKYGTYVIADPSLANRPDRLRQMLLGYSRSESLDDGSATNVGYILIMCIQDPLVWEGVIINLEIPYLDLDMKPGRMRLVSEGNSSDLRACRHRLAELNGGSDFFDVAVEAKSHLARVNHELLRVRRLLFRLSMSVMNNTMDFRAKYKRKDCIDTIESLFVFAREFSQRGIQVMDATRRGTIAIKLINLCIDWVSFVCEDCDPTDYKTYRWSVTALEFAMVMTRGVNIVAISDEQFTTLRMMVSRSMSLMISHFDIMGARSQAAEEQRVQKMTKDSKTNLQFKDDGDLIEMFSGGAYRSIEKLEHARNERSVTTGKVLDDTNTDSEFLEFLVTSFNNNTQMRWQQGRFIGGGSFGSVYAAVNLDSGGVMAVKEIRLHDSQSIRRLLKSIKDEMSVLEILSHPNIVQYYGVEVHRDKVCIFMEYCQGGSLAGLLEYGRIEDESVIQVYTLQMLEGLAYLHQANIVHRDIKPENILLDHMGVIKFVDFGAAKVIAKQGRTTQGGGVLNNVGGTKTKLNSMTGTPMYMSPEIITGRNLGRFGSIDIWSTGCCVLEMATGRRPWANLDNEWAIMYHIAAGHLPQLPSKEQLSEAGHQFLMKCLERDPTVRPTAVELLTDPWIVYIRNIVLSGYEPQPELSVVSSSGSTPTTATSEDLASTLNEDHDYGTPL